jgi:hypothetical protein
VSAFGLPKWVKVPSDYIDVKVWGDDPNSKEFQQFYDGFEFGEGVSGQKYAFIGKCGNASTESFTTADGSATWGVVVFTKDHGVPFSDIAHAPEDAVYWWGRDVVFVFFDKRPKIAQDDLVVVFGRFANIITR